MSSTDVSRFLFPLLVFPLVPDGVVAGDSPMELFNDTLAESGVEGALFCTDWSSMSVLSSGFLGVLESVFYINNTDMLVNIDKI